MTLRRMAMVPVAVGLVLALGAPVQAAPSEETTVRVYLTGRDPAGLVATARSVSDPGSPHYQHFLTPDQARSRFGPTRRQTEGVSGWLTAAGLRVDVTTSHYVQARGTAAAMRAAFGSTRTRPEVPASLAGDVLGVTGIDAAPAPLAAPEAAPAPNCSAHFGASPATELPTAYDTTPPWSVCGYTGRQLRGAYGITASGLTGAGATVAIVNQGALPTMRADAARVATAHGDRPFRDGQYRELLLCARDDSCAKPGAHDGEQALDVEAVHAMAPDADVLYVGTSTAAADANLDGLIEVVDHRLADIVSNSWYVKGTDETVPAATIAAYERVFLLGAVEGVSFFFGTGDAGDQAFDGQAPGWDGQPNVNFPASDPWVSAVGGTSLAIGRHDDYLFETGWGSAMATLSTDGTGWDVLPGAFVGGAGGGTSERFAQPSYQRGVVPAALSRSRGGRPMRVLPDLAANADPFTGLRIGYTDPTTGEYAEHTTGGTSLACPLVAGLHAAIHQARGGRPAGFVNPTLYRGDDYLRDVTDEPLGPGVPIVEATPNSKKQPGRPGLVTFGHDTSLHAVHGYDPVTGLGTPALR